MFRWEEKQNISLENYTLILPAIAVGNVGQLAVDLLLNNIKAESIAYLHHPCFFPIAGADPFDPNSNKLATSCQMYQCKEKKLVIIQHRAPLVKSRVSEYMGYLVKFIKEHKIKRTIMLSSSFAQFFTYEQLQNVPLHYLCTTHFEEEKALQTLHLKKFMLPVADTSAIPGGGISQRFLDTCERHNIPLALLIMVCSEGDNYVEANRMVSNLNDWLHIREGDSKSIQWCKPFSWDFPYANDAPHVIY